MESRGPSTLATVRRHHSPGGGARAKIPREHSPPSTNSSHPLELTLPPLQQATCLYEKTRAPRDGAHTAPACAVGPGRSSPVHPGPSPLWRFPLGFFPVKKHLFKPPTNRLSQRGQNPPLRESQHHSPSFPHWGSLIGADTLVFPEQFLSLVSPPLSTSNDFLCQLLRAPATHAAHLFSVFGLRREALARGVDPWLQM